MTKETNGSQKLNELSTSIKIPEYNVLLFGETGVGKSTTINAWATYMRHRTLKEAKYGKLELMIPIKFKLLEPVTNEPIDIECGLNDDNDDAKNEAFNEEGSSVTQMPSAYTFKFKDKVLRIIDTPGICDPRGVNVDRENIDNIFAYLNNYKELHAIVILLKANMSRISTSFRYCISELLNHLHKDATKNVLFCFTFSRHTLFHPADAYYTVNQFFANDFPEVELKLKSDENCFFIDNDFFRYLAAVKHDYPFDSDEKKIYREIGEIWEKSTEQSSRIWDRITREIEPHNLTDTISLNSTRKFILKMAELLVYLQNAIQSIIHLIKKNENILKNDLSNIYYIKSPTDEVGKINFEKRIKDYKDILKIMNCRIDVYKEEYEVIQDICSKFAYILVKYSITPFNKFIEPYLNVEIKEKYDQNPNQPYAQLNSLEKIKNLNHEIEEIINRTIKNGEQNSIKLLLDNYEYTEKLFKLEHTGEHLRQMFKDASWSKNKKIDQIQEKVLDLTNLTITNRGYSINKNNKSKQTEEKNHAEKSTKNVNQIDILSIIQQLKEELKEILIDDKSQQASSPITNMIYHLDNARNVILNANSQTTIGDVTMTSCQSTEQTMPNSGTDNVKSLTEAINALKEFCSKFSSTHNVAKIEKTISSLESVVASKTIYGYQDNRNSTTKGEFYPIHSEVVAQNSIDTRPETKESINSLLRMGGIIVIVVLVGFSIIRNKRSFGAQ